MVQQQTSTDHLSTTFAALSDPTRRAILARLEAAVAGNGNYSSLLPVSRITTTATRTWTDRNGDFAVLLARR